MALQQTGTQTIQKRSKWHYNKPAHRPHRNAANGTTTNRHTDHIETQQMALQQTGTQTIKKRSKWNYNKPAHRPHRNAASGTTTNRHTDHTETQQMALQQTGTQTIQKHSKWHYNKPAHRPHNSTLYDELHGCSTFHVTRKDLGNSLKMAHGCRNMLEPAYQIKKLI